MKKIIISIIILSIFLIGCAPSEPVVIPVADDSQATPEAISAVVNANNQFAFELYSELKNTETRNIFFSPYSISTSLTMTYEGARGQTADEMQSVLHIPEDPNIRRPGFAKIINQINKEDKSYQLNTANALWAHEDYKFLDEYFNTIQNYYTGKVTNLNFVKETEKSRVTINNWVEEQTNNKIKNLIPSGVLNVMTRLVLTNAIYFKGTWLIKFNKKDTKKRNFMITPDFPVEVPMMTLSGEKAKFNYAETEDVQLLELPYEGKKISMLIILPTQYLNSIELNAQNLAIWKNRMYEREVMVLLPKFKFETKYMMKETLEKMGMPTAFSMAADFSGMDGTKMLYIQQAIHQAFVEVNEEGTEAAAATAIVVGLKSSGPTVFNANHPFIFIIQERETGNILFMGRVIDPSISP